MSATVPDEHVRDTCGLGKGALCCSFLLMGPSGWKCAKSIGNESFFIMLLGRRLDGQIRAMGNNCNGIDPQPDIPPVKEWPSRESQA